MHAVTPHVADELGRYVLVQDTQHRACDHAHLVLGEGEVLRLRIALDVDARLLRRGAHRLLPCGVTGDLRRVVVTDGVDALRLDGLRGGECCTRCGEEKQRAAEGAQNMSDHAVHSLMGMRCPEMLSINYLVLFQIILKVK